MEKPSFPTKMYKGEFSGAKKLHFETLKNISTPIVLAYYLLVTILKRVKGFTAFIFKTFLFTQ